MANSNAPASYLPEPMIIKLTENIRLFDNQPQAIPTVQALSYFFHEYTHYLHNISTANGIAVFVNTLSLWDYFRHTITPNSHSDGSKGFDLNKSKHLKKLLANLASARQNNKPQTQLILSPVSIKISSYNLKNKIQNLDSSSMNIIECDSIIKDHGGQTSF